MEVASIPGHKDLKMPKRYTHLRAKDLTVKLWGELTFCITCVICNTKGG